MRGPALVSAIALLLSGCAGSDGTVRTTTGSSEAAAPSAAASLGSLHGRVVDDEKAPITGAEVALLDTPLQTKTDAQGAFTFNDLEPGEYAISVQKIGYEQSGRKATVVEGEVLRLEFILKAFVLQAEAYHVMVPRKTLIEFGYVLVDNRIPNGMSYCKSCDHYLFFEPKPVGLRLDQTSTNGAALPMDDIWFDFRIKWGNATGAHSQSDGSSLGSGYLKDRVPWNAPEGSVKALAKEEKVWYHVTGGAFAPSINRKIDSYITFAYVLPLPDDYSALPPK